LHDTVYGVTLTGSRPAHGHHYAPTTEVLYPAPMTHQLHEAQTQGSITAGPQEPIGTQTPRSPAHLFLAFSMIALQGFGGILGIIQRELVERRHWLTNRDFLEDWSVAQVLPGPNVVNLGIIFGARHFGLAGAVAAVSGLLLFPLILVLGFGVLYGTYAHYPEVNGALKAMSAVATGLIAAAGLKLGVSLKGHPLGRLQCIVAASISFIAVAILRIPLAYVLLGIGTIACLLTYRRLRSRA